MQLSRTDVSTMTPMQLEELKQLINEIHHCEMSYQEGLFGNWWDGIDNAVADIEKMAESYGNRCYFCNESETSNNLILGEGRWEGSVDLIINGSQRGNLICDLDACGMAYHNLFNKKK